MNATTDNSSIRDALESSFEGVEENTNAAPESSAVEPVITESAHQEPQAEEQSAEQAQREYERDEQGKFAQKDEKKNAKANIQQNNVENAAQEGIKAAPKSNQPPSREWSTEKAPQAWKPEAREYWQQLPEPVRREVVRHAQAANDAISQNVEARRFADAVQRTIAPFEHFIKAEGSNPIQAIDNMMSAAALLRTGTADQIANLVSQITHQYGVGRFGREFVEKLDNALAGTAKPPENPEVAAMRQQMAQELAPLRQWQMQMSQMQQMQAQKANQDAQTEIERFANNAEFLDDVRMEMADIIDMGAARGVNYSLQQAYEIACRAHPEISKVLMQREKSQSMQNMNQNTQKAKQAAVSLGGAPSIGGNGQAPSSLRDSLELAFSQTAR